MFLDCHTWMTKNLNHFPSTSICINNRYETNQLQPSNVILHYVFKIIDLCCKSLGGPDHAHFL